MLGEYIMDGFKVAVVVAAMLIGFVAIIAMINGIFSADSFETILVAMILPAFTASCHGIPIRKANGAKINPSSSWNDMPSAALKMPLIIAMIATNPRPRRYWGNLKYSFR